MAMQPVVFKIALFRGDWDQARSQLSLLWMLEALVRINQSHIRQFRHMQADGQIPTAYPPLYRSGVHYEREKGTEEWLDIPHILDPAGNSPGGPEYPPGPWCDCLPLSTLVLRDDHEIVPISSLKPGDKIADGKGWTMVLEHAITGEKPILAIDLNNGSTLRCSPQHRVFLANGNEVRAEDLKPGDLLRTAEEIPSASPWIGDARLSPDDFAWMLGLHVADGWCDLPRRHRFAISGKDGHPKEAQKKRVQEIMERAGIATNWHERYIGVNDHDLSEIMNLCGHGAPNKHLPRLAMSKEQVAACVAGLKADAAIASNEIGTVVHGTTSQKLAIQLRVMQRMLGRSTHIRRWDDHGGLGKNPIYRITVRHREDEYIEKKSHIRAHARIVGIREEAEELCCDITTDTGRFWLPESDLVVHNCEDLAGYRAAEWRELPYHYRGIGNDGKPMLADPRLMPCYEPIGRRFQKVQGGVPSKPFAKWRQREDGSFAYHALTILPDGRLEDPSLVLGMTWEDEFHRLGLAEKFKNGTMAPRIRYADPPDVVVIDPEKRSGYGTSPTLAKRLTGLTTLNGDALSYEALAKSDVAACGYDLKNEASVSDLFEVGFREGPLGRIGIIGRPDSNWASRFNFITQSVPHFVKR